MSLVKTSPIIAIATGNGNAGVGIVRISGEEEDVKALFQKMFPGKEIKPRYAELFQSETLRVKYWIPEL